MDAAKLHLEWIGPHTVEAEEELHHGTGGRGVGRARARKLGSSIADRPPENR